MLKRLPFFLLILVALFSCKTKPTEEEIAAADDMRTQAVEAQEKALSVGADQKAADLWQQGVDALAAGADAFLTGEIRYHEYFGHERDILLIETGHYESEQYTKDLLRDILHAACPSLKTELTKLNTNPIKYL